MTILNLLSDSDFQFIYENMVETFYRCKTYYGVYDLRYYTRRNNWNIFFTPARESLAITGSAKVDKRHNAIYIAQLHDLDAQSGTGVVSCEWSKENLKRSVRMINAR